MAQMPKAKVPMPVDGYFDSLADATFDMRESHKVVEKRVVRLWPMAASLAAAASVALAIIFWPTAEAPTALSWANLTSEDLAQYALLDDDLLEARLMEDTALLSTVSHNQQFQYIQPQTQSDEYNRLLLEMIDDETFMEDFL